MKTGFEKKDWKAETRIKCCYQSNNTQGQILVFVVAVIVPICWYLSCFFRGNLGGENRSHLTPYNFVDKDCFQNKLFKDFQMFTLRKDSISKT